jgi:hypothetical protein
MSKPGRGKEGTSTRRRKKRVWQGVLAVLVLGALASSWYLMSGGRSSGSETLPAEQAQQPTEPLPPSLQNRMVLPARPRTPRPVTLNPESFASNSNSEVYSSYKAAKDVPEVLEHMPCYCGCFGTSGHRNNLDCYTDNHGVT